MSELYLEDFVVGQRFVSKNFTLDEATLIAFARDYDPQPFHTDPEAAKSSFFKGLVASGWHTAALTMRLLVASDFSPAGGIVGAGGLLHWPRPLRAGDTIRVEVEVLGIRPSTSRPQGRVKLKIVTKNQHDLPVQEFTVDTVVPGRVM